MSLFLEKQSKKYKIIILAAQQNLILAIIRKQKNSGLIISLRLEFIPK